MAKIKITIPNESAEHREWAERMRALESVVPELRTDEQWDAIAAAYEEEPAYGEGARTYYVPAEIPAEKVQRLPRSVFEQEENSSFAFTKALLSFYLPSGAIKALTVQQLAVINRGLFGDSQGES